MIAETMLDVAIDALKKIYDNVDKTPDGDVLGTLSGHNCREIAEKALCDMGINQEEEGDT